jgi:hypothetical protein
MPPTTPQPHLRFDLPDDLKAGVYANFVGVDANIHDYVLTFYRLMAPVQDRREEIEARAVCRVTISPTLVDPLIAVLQRSKSQREELLQLAAQGEQRE